MKNGKLLSVIASLGVISSVFSAVPFAAGAVSSDEITFDKYLVMENEATVPNVSFGFEVSPIEDSETKAATDDTLAVFKGDANIKFKSGDDLEVDENNDKKVNVSFKNTDSAQREAEAGDRSIEFKTSDTDDEKFAEKSIILDLKDVNFTAAGVYRYKLTETRDENIAGVEGNDVTRYLDIFVGNDSENNLAVLGYFIHTGDSAPKSGAVDSSGKSSGFCNYYVSNDLAFHKEVTGNQGSKDKYFKFTVQLTNADNLTVNDEDTFKLSGSWDKDPSPKTAVDVYSADVMKTANNRTEVKYSELKNGYSFYVRSGDNIQINGIPSGLGYVITEAHEKYTPSFAFAADSDSKTNDKDGEGTEISAVKNDSDKSYSVEDSYLKSNTLLNFRNDKSGAIPSGVLTAVASSVGIAVIGLIGVVVGIFCMKKKKTEEK